MRRLETTAHIDATPDLVWAVLTDFASYDEWSPTLQVTGRAERGQRLVITGTMASGKQMTFRPTVLAAEPGRVLRWRGRLFVPGLFDGVHEFLLTGEGDGTRLVHAEDFSGILVPFLGKLLAHTEANMHAQNAALKERAESSVAA
jgi:hypothetical protein